MSVISDSVSKRSQSIRRVMRFKFTNLELSYQVRQRVYELLISFDDNVNYEFEKPQIERALVEILHENKQQLSYVTNNIFRYDANKDGIITYEQFANFCVEQHFGQMAIQRLHKKGVYSRGRQKLMTKTQFMKTLQYCLSFIQVIPKIEQMQIIFDDVDTNQDGLISYSQYFTLLREYFGSQSQSARAITVENVSRKKIQAPPSQQQNQSKFKQEQKVRTLAQRLSRIIFHQFRIYIINTDLENKLSIDEKVGRDLLQNKLKMSYNRIEALFQFIFGNLKVIKYQEFVERFLEFYMCQLTLQDIKFPLDKIEFCEMFIRLISFIGVKSSSLILEEIWQKIGKQKMDKEIYGKLMEIIFVKYKLPRRTGQKRSHENSVLR